jgi:hypothetical protein
LPLKKLDLGNLKTFDRKTFDRKSLTEFNRNDHLTESSLDRKGHLTENVILGFAPGFLILKNTIFQKIHLYAIRHRFSF